MSKLRSTHLRDTRPNRRNSSVPKLQCGGHRSEDLYPTSPSTGAASKVRMSKLRSTHLRDTRPNRRNSSVPELQCAGHRSEDLYLTSPTTSATTDKIPGKETLRDHRDFDRPSCGGAGQDQETKKMDRRFHRRAELADSSVRRVQRGPVFRGHFRSQGKEIRV